MKMKSYLLISLILIFIINDINSQQLLPFNKNNEFLFDTFSYNNFLQSFINNYFSELNYTPFPNVTEKCVEQFNNFTNGLIKGEYWSKKGISYFSSTFTI